MILLIQIFPAHCLPVRRWICPDISTSKKPRLRRSAEDGLTCLSSCTSLSRRSRPIRSSTIFGSSQGGCVTGVPGDKDAISIVWHGGTKTWTANWVVITNCNPRAIELGDPVSFQFTEDGVKVRVALDDLLTATDENGTLIWHAGVRRMPFSGTGFVTVAVDYAPDVVEFNPSPPPILLILRTPPPGSLVRA